MALSRRRDRLRFTVMKAGYKALGIVAAHLPMKVHSALARLGGTLTFYGSKKKRLIVATQLQKVCGSDDLTKQAFISYSRYWLNAFRVPGLPREALPKLMSADTFDTVEQARARGRGVIFALPHVGNWDVAGAWLVNQGVPLTVVVEQLEPEMFAWFERFRESLGLKVVGNGPGVSGKLIAALHRNEAIALLCDRDVDGTGALYEFFGEKTSLPKGPATLALRTGAALLPCAAYEEGDKFHAVILPPIDTRRMGSLRDDVDRVTADLVTELEGLIRRAPEQWHVFQPNWPSVRELVGE